LNTAAKKAYIEEEFTRILSDLQRLEVKIEVLKKDLKNWISE